MKKLIDIILLASIALFISLAILFGYLDSSSLGDSFKLWPISVVFLSLALITCIARLVYLLIKHKKV